MIKPRITPPEDRADIDRRIADRRTQAANDRLWMDEETWTERYGPGWDETDPDGESQRRTHGL